MYVLLNNYKYKHVWAHFITRYYLFNILGAT